jgi:hypothetical protein
MTRSERAALLTDAAAMRRHVLNEPYWWRAVPWPGDTTRFVNCEYCDGEGRIGYGGCFGGDRHSARCPVCNGECVEEVETEPVSEEDIMQTGVT